MSNFSRLECGQNHPDDKGEGHAAVHHFLVLAEGVRSLCDQSEGDGLQ